MDASGDRAPLLPHVDDRVRLPREALDAVDWLDGEAIRTVWASGSGFLVVSTLRCVLLRRGDGVERAARWFAGAEYRFFNFAEPRVVGLDEIELAEEFFEGREARFPVRDPIAVQQALSEAREAGKAAWALRRRRDEPTLPTERRALGSGAAEATRPAPRSPCRSCGNLYETTAQRCPYCAQPRAVVRPTRRGRR